MIIDYKMLSKEVSKEQDIDLNLLLSINNVVFTELFNWSKKPSALKIYLKNIGGWFFKKRKTLDKIKVYKKILDSDMSLSDKDKEKIKTKIQNYNFILSEYVKYTEERYKIKCEKYGKEAYEAYCLAMEQEKIQKTKKNKSI